MGEAVQVEVLIERDADVPKAALWALLEDFANLDWYDGGDVTDSQGSGVGMWREVRIPGLDEPARETVTALDASSCTLEYRVEMKDSFFSDYSARAQLSDSDGGGTRVNWRASFVTDAMPADDAREIINGIYSSMIDQIVSAAAS